MTKKARDKSGQKRLVSQDLSRRVSSFGFSELSMVIGERALELIVNLIIFVLVERRYDESALGIYSYILSLYHISAYLAEFGIPRYVERETALHPESQSEQARVFNNAFQAVLISAVLVGLLCFLSAAYDASHTRIQERVAAYFIIGLAIPFRNLNRLRLSSLNGRGRHEEAAKLQGKKRVVLLGAVLGLVTVRVFPSYLALGFLLSEIYLALAGRRKLKLPSIRSALVGLDRVRCTLREGYRFFFTDDALDVVLYIDLFILGIFMSAWDPGKILPTDSSRSACALQAQVLCLHRKRRAPPGLSPASQSRIKPLFSPFAAGSLFSALLPSNPPLFLRYGRRRAPRFSALQGFHSRDSFLGLGDRFRAPLRGPRPGGFLEKIHDVGFCRKLRPQCLPGSF
jgi:hypothetical protein